jgi:hypothetical protein
VFVLRCAGSGIGDELITRSERVLPCVCECDILVETSTMGWPKPVLGCSATKKKQSRSDVLGTKEHPVCVVAISQSSSYTDLRYPDLGS